MGCPALRAAVVLHWFSLHYRYPVSEVWMWYFYISVYTWIAALVVLCSGVDPHVVSLSLLAHAQQLVSHLPVVLNTM